MTHESTEQAILVSFVKVKAEVPRDRFAAFATSRDMPTWRRKDVVVSFNTYAATDGDTPFALDFIEIMHVRSLPEWETVSQTDPDIAELASEFRELVDESTTWNLRLAPIESAQGA